MMRKWCIKSKTFCGICLVVLGACSSPNGGSRVEMLPYYDEATFTPKWMNTSEADLSTFHQIPAFTLYNQEGEVITERTFEEKIYIANFFFTSCPGICPKMAVNMKMLQDTFLVDDEILLLSHSVTPEMDSVPVLKAYAKTNAINSDKWHVVTGNQQEIYNLGRKSYFVEEDLGLLKEEDEFLHTENFVLIDKNRRIRGIYNGLNSTAIDQLITDVQTLKKEGHS